MQVKSSRHPVVVSVPICQYDGQFFIWVAWCYIVLYAYLFTVNGTLLFEFTWIPYSNKCEWSSHPSSIDYLVSIDTILISLSLSGIWSVSYNNTFSLYPSSVSVWIWGYKSKRREEHCYFNIWIYHFQSKTLVCSVLSLSKHGLPFQWEYTVLLLWLVRLTYLFSPYHLIFCIKYIFRYGLC